MYLRDSLGSEKDFYVSQIIMKWDSLRIINLCNVCQPVNIIILCNYMPLFHKNDVLLITNYHAIH